MKHVGLLLLAIFAASSAFAFPENVRHGYTNCVTCHVSPTGGGILTEYGRELSKELQSTWSAGNEQRFLYFYDMENPVTQWLNLGGDIRDAQVFIETPYNKSARFIRMQADLEMAVSYKRFTADATYGFDGNAPRDLTVFSGSPEQFNLPWASGISRRHYLMAHLTDELALRAGRFNMAYGINTPEHVISIKRGLGWDEGSETYNLEGSWIAQKWNVYATAVFGRPDDEVINQTREKGAAVQVSRSLGENYKIGANVFKGTNIVHDRIVAGAFGDLGFTQSIYLLTELDWQQTTSKIDQYVTTGMVNYQKLGWEFYKGFHLFGTEEFTQSDFSNGQSISHTYGFGIQMFPRPHFEILSFWEKTQDLSQYPHWDDWICVMGHYYL